jgi:Na+/proline symporter
MRMYITWTDFLQFTLVVLGIITVCITVNDNKKK